MKRLLTLLATTLTLCSLTVPAMADVTVGMKLCMKPGGGLYIVPGPGHMNQGNSCGSGDQSFALMPIELGKAVLSGYNLQVVNGTGSTQVKNGSGNIFVGYNEDPNLVDGFNHERPPSDRSGSHNLIVGRGHSYGSFGSLLSGYYNRGDGSESCACGGAYNSASGITAAVIGGMDNDAAGDVSVVLGGVDNNASADMSTIDGSIGDGQTTP